MMLIIDAHLVDAMVAQAYQDHPLETCGVIAGAEGSNTPSRLIPMRNAAGSESFFEFDPQQQLQVWREMEANDEEPVVIYHSHTSSQAYPSRTDIQFATEPRAHYVIITTDSRFEDSLRSFRIIDGSVTEERIQIVNQTEPQPSALDNFMQSILPPILEPA